MNATLTRADEAMKNHDYAAVATALETLKWKFQDKPDYWYNLGVAYFNLKDALKAAEPIAPWTNLMRRTSKASK